MNKYLKDPKWIENESYKPEYAKYLIEAGVYERNPKYDYIIEESENKEDSSTFQNIIIFCKKAYTLSNSTKNEMYEMFEREIKLLYHLKHLDKPFYQILLGQKKYFTKEEQIHFLTEKHTEFLDKVQDKECYLLYSDNIPIFGQSTWKEFVFDCLFNAFEPNVWFVHDYFTSDISIQNYFLDELSDWYLFYEVKLMTDFIAKKIQELKNNQGESISYEKSTTSNRNDFSYHIFKTYEAEQKFRFLVSEIQTDKKKAFFSYLYFYFKDELKELVVLGNTNKPYLDFVKKNLWVDKNEFPRIIKAPTENSEEQRKMYSAFEAKLKSCSFDE